LRFIHHNDDVAVPNSKLSLLWIYSKREYEHPYRKCFQLTTRTELGRWPELAAGWVDEVESRHAEGVNLFMQCQQFGGPTSAMRTGDDGKTAFAWRDATLAMNFDLYHDAMAKPDAARLADELRARYLERAVGPGGAFSDADLRWLWASHGDRDLSRAWPHYMSAPTHDRLLRIKQSYDPRSVFSPSAFGIGGAKRPFVAGASEAGAPVDDRVYGATLRDAAAAGRKRSEL
jgi:hypothetical protein